MDSTNILQKRIPTIFALAIMLISMVGGVALITTNQAVRIQANASLKPKGVTVVNLGATSASVYWVTDQEAIGFIEAGQNQTLLNTFKDDRDIQEPKIHRLHFITLDNLDPNTTYYYKIHSGGVVYPENGLEQFKTTPDLGQTDYLPIIGNIINKDSQPVQEAIISLDIPGAQTVATITKYAGNFILPLSELKTKDLSQKFNLSIPRSSQIQVFNWEQSSQIILDLPQPLPQPLPPIIFGQDLDLTSKPDLGVTDATTSAIYTRDQ